MITTRTILTVLALCVTATAHAAGLSFTSVAGPRDLPVGGIARIDTTDEAGRLAVRFRLAQNFSDLPRASWRDVTSTVMNVSWLFPGFQIALDNVVAAEIQYHTGANVIVSAAEDMRARTASWTLPRNFLRPSPGVLFRIVSTDTTGYGAWPLVQYNDQGFSIARYAPGNNFVPLDWSSAGYAWSSEFTRGVDKGETKFPTTLIVAHTYASWLDSTINFMDWSPSSTALLVELAGDSLDMKGGRAYFAVLMTLPDGRHARYHLRRPLAIGTGSQFLESGWYVPSGSSPDWVCSFASNNVPCNQMPSPGPDLRYISAVEIVIADGTAAPTGTLKIRNLQVWQ